MADLRDDIALLEDKKILLEAMAGELEDQLEAQKKNKEESKEYLKVLQQIRDVEKEIIDIEKDKVSLSKQLDDLSGTFTDAALKELGITSSINALKEAAKTNDKDVLENSKDLASILQGVLSGEMDHLDIREKAINMGGKAKQIANEIADAVEKNPGMMKVFSVKSAVLSSIRSATSGVLGAVTGLVRQLGPIGVLVFLINKVVEKIVEFAKGAIEVRKNLGVTVGQAAILSERMTTAATATEMMGGDAQRAKDLVQGLAEEFGTVGEATDLSRTNVALLSTQLGIGGKESAKLLKAMSDITGQTKDSLASQLLFQDSLSESQGIVSGLVMKEVADNTAEFARVGAQGADALFDAARAAVDLGTNLSTVASVMDGLLDIESSLAAEMEAEALLGRQLNLDRARQLAQANDYEGVIQELLSQTGGAASFSALGRIEQNALARAFNLSIDQIQPFLSGGGDASVNTPQIAKDQLTGINNTNELLSKEHGKQQQRHDEIVVALNDLYRVTKRAMA